MKASGCWLNKLSNSTEPGAAAPGAARPWQHQDLAAEYLRDDQAWCGVLVRAGGVVQRDQVGTVAMLAHECFKPIAVKPAPHAPWVSHQNSS